jgi:hypothetical protein
MCVHAYSGHAEWQLTVGNVLYQASSLEPPPYQSCCLAVTGFCYFVVACNLISTSTTTVLTQNHIANPFSLAIMHEDPRNGKLRSTRQVQRLGEAN